MSGAAGQRPVCLAADTDCCQRLAAYWPRGLGGPDDLFRHLRRRDLGGADSYGTVYTADPLDDGNAAAATGVKG